MCKTPFRVILTFFGIAYILDIKCCFHASHLLQYQKYQLLVKKYNRRLQKLFFQVDNWCKIIVLNLKKALTKPDV